MCAMWRSERATRLSLTPVSNKPSGNQRASGADGEDQVNAMTESAEIEAIARSFVEARRAGRALPDYPGAMPADLAAAYAVQDAALALVGTPVAGWKVGRINPPIGDVDRLAGPAFADTVFVASDQARAMPIFADGFGAAEAEFLLRIGPDFDPARTSYTMAEAAAAIDAVHAGIEIASSPFPGINDHGAAVTISDFGNNNGIVVGPAIAGGAAIPFNDWTVELRINDAVIGRATTATMLDGPIGAARFLFELMAARGIALSPGQWISSGAVTGVHPVKIGDRIEARFDDRYAVKCTIKAA